MMLLKKTIIQIISAFVLCLIVGCGNEAPENQAEAQAEQVKEAFKNCKYKPPVAVFSADLPQVKAHFFELKDREGLEVVSFDNDTELELIQNGCDKITQYYNFTLSGQHEGDAAYWINQAVEKFQYLGSIDKKYSVLTFWGQAMETKKNEFGLGEAVEVQPGFYAEINKVVSSDHAIVNVKLSEK